MRIHILSLIIYLCSQWLLMLDSLNNGIKLISVISFSNVELIIFEL